MSLEAKLQGVEERYVELDQLMADPEIAVDYERVAELAQEKSQIEPVVFKFREYRDAAEQLDEAKELLSDPEIADMAREEVERLEVLVPELEDQLKVLLLPKDPRDDKNVIVEIRAGAGGDEAGIFAADLFRMYTRYADRQRWKTDILSSSETGVGGFKTVVFEVKGQGAYSRL